MILVFLGFGALDSKADDDESRPMLLLPSNLGEVRFGDPIYVPIVIVNRSEFAARCPQLSRGSPAINCYFSTPNQKWEGNCKIGQGRHELPARHAESTVVCIDIWHPKNARFLFDSRKVLLSLEEIDKNGNRNNGVSAQTTATIAGSAFKHDAWILSLAEKSSEALTLRKINALKSDHFPYPPQEKELLEAEKITRDALPLHQISTVYRPSEFGAFWWLEFADEKFGLNVRTSFDDLNEDGEWNYRYKSLLDENSALFRLVRSIEIINKMRQINGKEIHGLVREYKNNLRYASHAEYVFLVQYFYYGVETKYSVHEREMFAQDFPEVLSFVDIYKSGSVSKLLPIPQGNKNSHSK